MSITAGSSLSLVSQGSTTISLLATAATGGDCTILISIGTVLLHQDFSPGGENIISGATSLLHLMTRALFREPQYYYVLVATDSAGSPATVDYAQFAASSLAPTQNPNQFTQAPYLGMIDMRFPYNSVSVLVDQSQASPLFPGAAVKMVDSVGGVPKVVACSADSDNVLGFINFDIKSISFSAGQPCEISMGGNVMYLYATAAISRGVQVTLDLSTNGGVAAAVSGHNIVGWSYDKATAPGQLIRVFLKSPSFASA